MPFSCSAATPAVTECRRDAESTAPAGLEETPLLLPPCCRGAMNPVAAVAAIETIVASGSGGTLRSSGSIHGSSWKATSCRGRTTLKWRRSSVATSVASRRSAVAITEASTVPSGRSRYSATSSAMRTGSLACSGSTAKLPSARSPRKRTSACQPSRVPIR